MIPGTANGSKGDGLCALQARSKVPFVVPGKGRKKTGQKHIASGLVLLVGGTRFELVTPTVSR